MWALLLIDWNDFGVRPSPFYSKIFLCYNDRDRSSHPERVLGKVFWRYTAHLHESIHAEVQFNKATKELYWNHTLTWVFSCKFAAYFQNGFSKEHIWTATFEGKDFFSQKTEIFFSFASEMLRIARSTTDVINMVTHVKLQLIRMKSKLANVLVSFHYWKKSLGDALKCFVSFHKLLMNLLNSSRYN